MSDLVQKLAQGEHPVEVNIRPTLNAKALKERIDDGFMHVKFTDTRGGTELSVRLDQSLSELNADFETGAGRVKLVGSLTLDKQKVQCVAEIDLRSFTGKGRLIPI